MAAAKVDPRRRATVDPLINAEVPAKVTLHAEFPFARRAPLFYYNKDAFAAAGLPDRGPANMGRIRRMGAKAWPEAQRYASHGNARCSCQDSPYQPLIRMASMMPFAHPNSASYVAWLFQGVIPATQRQV
jgi:sn-glycerol 3-phosphate transport system substrate-binding protein